MSAFEQISVLFCIFAAMIIALYCPLLYIQYMDKKLLARLDAITDEEKAILAGHKDIDRTLYYNPAGRKSDVIDSSLVLQNGKLIDIRPHVRFVHFPRHTHNFVEFVYMCQGSTTHIIDGQKIVLKEGDLLFLNQHAIQEIMPAGRNDIAVNFMILPQFFDTAFQMIGTEPSALRDFIISCLTDKNSDGNYLYFAVSGITEISNLMENLILTMYSESPNKRSIAQTTMGLLFMNLMNHTEKITVSFNSYEEDIIIKLLSYIETEYKDATLTCFADKNGIDLYTISRLVHKRTGSNFRELLQNKRLTQSCYLLRSTKLPSSEIAVSVGYENVSFFHRLFKRVYGETPGEYRTGG